MPITSCQQDGLFFEYKDWLNGWQVTGFLPSLAQNKSEIIIPDYVQGAKVLAIGKEAFAYSEFTKVKLPSFLCIIGFGAFMHMPKLEVVTMGSARQEKSDIHFGGKAFFECCNLVLFDINGIARFVDDGYQFAFCYSFNPDDFALGSSLPKHAFEDCINMKTLTFATDLPVQIGDEALRNVELKTVNFCQDFQGAIAELKPYLKHAEHISCPANSCVTELAYEGYPIFIDANL